MTLTHRKILITGGSSGIGLELCKYLVKHKNEIITCGRSATKLAALKSAYPSIETYQCDLSNANEIEAMVNWIKEKHPNVDVLINNAAIVHENNFIDTNSALEQARLEMAVNFFAPLQLIHQLSPILLSQKAPTIINITTGLIYAPKAAYSFYNSTKSALHRFTEVLRIQSTDTPLKVIEVMFPVVDTPWHQNDPPRIAIPPQKAVSGMIKGIANDKIEIRVGAVKLLYLLSRIAPKFALKKINSLN